MSAAKKYSSLLDEEVAETLRSHVREEQICIVDGERPGKVISLVIDEGYNQVVQRENPFHSAEVNTTALLSFNPVAFFENPVSAVFTPDQISKENDEQYTYFRQAFHEVRQKKGFLNGLSKALDVRLKSTSLRADVITIADELFTNAIYNAPFVNEHDRTGAARGDNDVRMHEGMFGELILAGDADRILVVCRDSYGSLDPTRMLERVKNCYTKGVAANINLDGKGGAGIGSYMIFNSSVSFFVAVQERRRTLVGCVLPIKGSGRARAEMVKNLHFIFVK